MNNKYEFEQTKSDNKKAQMTVASLIMLGVGGAIKYVLDSKKDKKRAQYDAKIDRMSEQYREFDTRILQTPKVKNEKKRIEKEINDLQDKRNKL